MVKINSLEIENIKRIKAVSLEPAENGLTVIGGRNGQGKTSVLDALAWALGGDKFKPSNPQRDGSVIPPHLRVELSNGLIVERKGDNGTLKVTDPSGKKGGQQLLNEFVEQLALNLPKFMQQNSKEKADTLLKIVGVGDKLKVIENDIERFYNQRTEIGRIADQKQKYADELPSFPEAPTVEISVSELIKKQQVILARNGENQRKRSERERFDRELEQARINFSRASEALEKAEQNAAIAHKSAEDLQDESTAEIEQSIADIEQINAKIRENIKRENAEREASDLRSQYNELTDRIEALRKDKTELLDGADLPLTGLSVEDGELTYNGAKWDCMSGAEQLKVGAAIVRKLNPNCGFVLIDKLEQMDEQTLREFGEWLENEGLQVIATRVSTGDECSIIIEDGTSHIPETTQKQTWTKGVF